MSETPPRPPDDDSPAGDSGALPPRTPSPDPVGPPDGGRAPEPPEPHTRRPVSARLRALPWGRIGAWGAGVLATALAGWGTILLTGAGQSMFGHHDATSAAHHSPSAGPIAHISVNDDQDPINAGCDQHVVDLSSVRITTADNEAVGYAVARYSPACAAVWARFSPFATINAIAPHAQISLVAVRPADGRRLPYKHAYTGDPVWGNMLLTSTGCVTVTVTVTSPALHTPLTASTRCVRH